ncbi:LGFP repeat-containing protein [Rhodococcoides fascians]|uniref:LGFP repeat-containing protein n=1 Tax=Rhodococcoides fascians TaxID=1828 RepID=UPI001E4D2D2C|nr:hypothetical protein [Rhodococcus fascians]
MAQAPLPAEPAADEPIAPTDEELSSKTAEPDPDWTPTENPNATIVPGQMRSDREEIPAPFTKEDADKAEVAEARMRMSRNANTCQVYWPSWFNVCGEIRNKYNSLGGPASFLSYPSSGNIVNPGNTGERVTFLNGPIYWSAATGAHPVVNSFLYRWGQNGYEAGWLKYPTTDEIVLPDGGRRQEFQQGAIYVAFQNAVGSAIQNGPLRDKYNSVGGLTPGSSFLGYLTEDHKRVLPDGQGQMARFQNGVIYWHPSTGAYPVSGILLTEWATEHYEQGYYGYPTSDQRPNGPSGVEQDFQNRLARWPNPVVATDSYDDSYDGPDLPYTEDYVGTNGSARDAFALRNGSNIGTASSCDSIGPSDQDGEFVCLAYGHPAADIVDPSVDSLQPTDELSPQARLAAAIQPAAGCEDGYESKKLAAAPSSAYWNGDRFYMCAVNPVQMQIRDLRTGALRGYVNVKLTQEIHTKQLETKSEYRVSVYVESAYRPRGMWVSADPQCLGALPCDAALQDAMSNAPLSVGTERFAYYKLGPNSLQANDVLSGSLDVPLTFTVPGIPSYTLVTPSPVVRCDRTIGDGGVTTKQVRGQGCVFSGRAPILDYASNPNINDVTTHIRQAQMSGLPGAKRLYATGPLTRLTVQDQIDRNRNRACPSGYYTATGYTCDEYPMAATNQGAAQPSGVVLPDNGRTFSQCQINRPPRVQQGRTGPSGYSICMVPRPAGGTDQNSAAGSQLSSFYTRNRVLAGDEFFVRADTGW